MTDAVADMETVRYDRDTQEFTGFYPCVDNFLP